MQTREFIGLLYVLFVIGSKSAFYAQTVTTDNKSSWSLKDTIATKTVPQKQIIVYYFYWTPRCYTCEEIERLTKETVTRNFKKERTTETVLFKAVDLGKKENAHYEKNYTLNTKSVIITETVDGIQKQWKNCVEIWDLYDNEKQFIEYLTKEINAYLK